MTRRAEAEPIGNIALTRANSASGAGGISYSNASLPVLTNVLGVAATNVQDAIDDLKRTTVTTLVYRPGGVTEGNVYASFAALAAVAALVAGPFQLYFDGSVNGGAAIVPAGTYALPPVTTLQSDQDTVVTLQNGVHFTGLRVLQVVDVNLLFQGVTPCISVTDPNGAIVRLMGSTFVTTTGGAAMFDASASGIIGVNLFAAAGTFSGTCISATGAAAIAAAIVYDGGTFGANTLAKSGGATFFVIRRSNAGNINVNQAGLGVFTITENAVASATGYSPFTGRSPQGATVQAALTNIQSGSAALTNGVSAAIVATITAGSDIVAFLKTDSSGTATTRYGALSADRVIGSPGSFKITALNGAAVNAADQSTLDWIILN